MMLSLCANIISLFVAILIRFDGFEGECSVIIKSMPLRLRTYSVIIKPMPLRLRTNITEKKVREKFREGPDAKSNTEIHKNSVRIKAPNSVNASKRKHKNQINHNDIQRRVLMGNSTVCQSK